MTEPSSPASTHMVSAKPVKILDPILANQIAAGEVVERPASAIKELLENALDAGSTELTVEIQEGGRRLMRVTDNGHGMSKDDALLSLERHATSKISDVADLNEISTLGFRGEALPSIASVSRLQIRSKTEKETSATVIKVEGGQNLQVSEGAGRIGTEVRVEDLFFNVPARRKFLKSPQTESGIIHEGVQRLALAYPQVGFKFIKDGHVSLELPQHTTSMERVRALFGSRVADHLCPVAWTGPVRLTGFVSHPSFHFSAHRHAYTFINGRFVKDRLFLGAIQRAFGQKLPRGRYPFYLLHLDIHPSLIDVNVHPAKTQVRFVNEEALLDVLTKAFKSAMKEMNFDEESPSWRNRVVDESVLKNESSPTTHSSAVLNERRVANEAEALEEHRSRIQERLRRRLHGEEVDLNTLAASTRMPANHRSDKAPTSLTTERVSPKSSKANLSIVAESPSRHGVTHVTQDELDSWRKGTSQSSKEQIETQVTVSNETNAPSIDENDDSGLQPLLEKNQENRSSSFGGLLTSSVDDHEARSSLPSLRSLHEVKARQSLRVVGRADEWWIQEALDGLMMVHLPSARAHAVTDCPQAVHLSTAIQMSLSPLEIKELNKHQDELIKLGVTLEPFGGQVYRLVTLPRGLETSSARRISAALSDLLSSRVEQLTVSWAKCLLSLPLTTEGRTFTLKWLSDGGAPDPSLPPFMVTMDFQELVRRCGHTSPF